MIDKNTLKTHNSHTTHNSPHIMKTRKLETHDLTESINCYNLQVEEIE